MAKVLVIATYPIKNPQHGGQKRTDAIVRAYKSSLPSVRFVSVFFKGFYKHSGRTDIPVGRDTQEAIRRSPLTGDIACGRAIYFDPLVKRRVSSLLKSYKPNIIHLEQPFTYLGLKPLLKELGMAPKIIFGSQNVEAPMKEEMLRNFGLEEEYVQEATRTISQLENELSQNCDLLAACTLSDLQAHQRMGAKNCVLAPNGVMKPKHEKKEKAHWRRYYTKKDISRLLVFVGSAHPPNWNGFMDMVGKGLGFIPTNTRLVLAGSICDFFSRSINEQNMDIMDATFWLRAHSAGRLSEERLIGLLDASDVILLPITEGGGSNLKTAEAIIMNKKVVTTSHALRSFEWFKNFPNVWVADSKEEFQKAITDSLESRFEERNEEQKMQAGNVLWDSCLRDLVGEVKKL